MNKIPYDYESVVGQAVYKQEELHIQDGFADGENGPEFGCRRRKRPKSENDFILTSHSRLALLNSPTKLTYHPAANTCAQRVK